MRRMKQRSLFKRGAPAVPGVNRIAPAAYEESVRTYGTLRLKKGQWELTAEPHVMIIAKRMFSQSSGRKYKTIRLSNTPEVCRDLDWFLTRYPLHVDGEIALRNGSDTHRDRQSLVERLLAGKVAPLEMNLALPPRDYQRTAAQMLMAVKRMILGDDLGVGKLQPVSARVLTPSGWRRIGDLQVGDQVIGASGQATEVTGVFPQGVQQVYRVMLSDGSSAPAGAEHLWSVDYWRGGRHKSTITLTTEQLLLRPIISGHGSRLLNLQRARLYLPMLSGPVEFAPGLPLPMHPYVLGVCIANGYLAGDGIVVTVNSDDWWTVRDRMYHHAALGYEREAQGCFAAKLLGLSKTIRGLELNVKSAAKFIPRPYLVASVEDRIALLQGLLDCDGSCSVTGSRVTYHTSSAQLSADIRELVEGLGGTASVVAYDRTLQGKGVEHRCRLKLPAWVTPFSVPRKSCRYQPGGEGPGRGHAHPTRRVIAVSDEGRSEESVCIRVAADDHLYVTEQAILTHNTLSAICPLVMGATPALIVTMTHLISQWRRELKRFAPSLDVHVLKTAKPYDYSKGGRHPDVLLSTYTKLDGWTETLAPLVKYIVFDECQELRSGPKRADVGEDGVEGTARGSLKCAAAAYLSTHAEYVIGLSATPFFNRGGELYWVMNAIKPGALGTRDEFKHAWCTGAEPKLSLTEPAAFGCMLRDAGLMLRRTREDVGQEMPPVTVVPHTVQTDHRVFEGVASRAAELARLVLDKGADKMDRFTASGDLDQMLRQATGLAKAPYVADFVELLLADDEPVVLFGWHKAVYDVWRERLGKFSPRFYTGDESPKQKDDAAKAFIAGDTKLLIISLRAGAGLDGLQQVCRTTVHGELDWSPAVHEQCDGRIDRPGQLQRVVAYYLLSETGSDPVVADVLGIKRAQIQGVNNPHRSDVLERIDRSGDHIKRLAELYLEKHRRTAA